MEIHITQEDINRANQIRKHYMMNPMIKVSTTCPAALAAKRVLLTECAVDGHILEEEDGTLYSLSSGAIDFVRAWDEYWGIKDECEGEECPDPITFRISKWR